MARPERNNVDYFPLYCDEGKKMFYLEETYGNDGFATFIKILRELAKTNYHYLDLSKNTTKMFLSAKCKISKETLESIINDLVDLEKFDSVLWSENSIIWCQDFVDSIQDAYSKRKNKCISYEGLLLHLISLGVRKQGKSKPKAPINTQSIVEYIKEEEIKENNIDNSQFFNDLIDSTSWLDVVGSQNQIKSDVVKMQLNTFDAHLITMLEQKNNKKEYAAHFTNWLKKQNLSHFREKVIGKTNQI